MINSDEEAYNAMVYGDCFISADELFEFTKYKKEDEYDYEFLILQKVTEEFISLARMVPDEDNYIWFCNIPKDSQLPFSQARRELGVNIEFDIRAPLSPPGNKEQAWLEQEYEGVWVRPMYYTQAPRLQDMWLK